jgi:hypothetical protein
MSHKYHITSQEILRKAFWKQHPHFSSEYRSTYKQNDYRTDIRIQWCDFINQLERTGVISYNLAYRATL